MDDTEKKVPSPAPAAPSGIKLNLIPKGNPPPAGVKVEPEASQPIAPVTKPKFEDSSTVQLRRPAPAVKAAPLPITLKTAGEAKAEAPKIDPLKTEVPKVEPVKAPAPKAEATEDDTSTKAIARPGANIAPAPAPAIKLTPKAPESAAAPKADPARQTVKLAPAPKTDADAAKQTVKLAPAPKVDADAAKKTVKLADAPEPKAEAPKVEVPKADEPKVGLKMKTDRSEEKATPPRLKNDLSKLQGVNRGGTAGRTQMLITAAVFLLVLYGVTLTAIQFLNFNNGTVFGEKLVETPIEVPGFMVGK